SAAAYSNSTSITVSYSASDAGPSGAKEVELWVKQTGSSHDRTPATDTTRIPPSFTYSAAAGDGTYNFYTRARDNAGNYEDAPASPPHAATTLFPYTTLFRSSAAAYSNSTSITVSYSASDAGPSGAKEVELWVK